MIWPKFKIGDRLTARLMNRITDTLIKLDSTRIEGYHKKDTGKGIEFRRAVTPRAVSAALAAAGAATYRVIDIDDAECILTCQRWERGVGALSSERFEVDFHPLLHRDAYDGHSILYEGIGRIDYLWIGGQRRRADLFTGQSTGSIAEEWITPPYVRHAGSAGSEAATIIAMPIQTGAETTRLTDVTGYRAWANAVEEF